MSKGWKIFTVILFVGCLVGGIVGGIAWTNKIKQFNSVVYSSSTNTQKSHASIVSGTTKFTSKKSGSYYNFEVTGKVINDGDYVLQYVYVEATFYNASEEQLDFSNTITGTLTLTEVALFTITDMCKQDAINVKLSLTWLAQ